MKQFPAPTPNFPRGTAHKNTGPDLLSDHPLKFPVSNLVPSLPFDSLQLMDILIKVEFAIAGNPHPICTGIRQSIKEQVPAREILNQIKMMAEDNFNGTADFIGVQLTSKILSL